VADLSERVRDHLKGWQGDDGRVRLRGRGALWVLGLPADMDAPALLARLYERGVCVGCHGLQIRLLPAVTMPLEDFDRACGIVALSLRDST
jgi:4-aminobutyrate aminotransferase-like enzyme